MKYMGSKRTMLQNGLGDLLATEVVRAERFVDLFTGSGAVSAHVAQRYPIPVLAVDLQQFSIVLADAVISRRKKLDWPSVWSRWENDARTQFTKVHAPPSENLTRSLVTDLRSWCAAQVRLPITRAYGGYYFSPRQGLWIDCLRMTLPEGEPACTVALAALVQASSQCAAAPGHTAQPFQPTRTGKPYLVELWGRDIVQRTKAALAALAVQFAKKRGNARVGDANEVAKRLREGDLAFIDPPYSGVQYSRFYHVLETVVRGKCVDVSGTGRYPAPEHRPHSRYNLKTCSSDAIDELLRTVAARGVRAIVTFPDHECSNGLSGETVREIATRYMRVRKRFVESRFSTLGGTGDERANEAGRAPRQGATEMMLLLAPK